MPAKLTQEQSMLNVIERCVQEKASLRDVFVYVNSKTQIPLVCGICGYDEWNPTYNSFVNYNSGCPSSCKTSKISSSLKLAQEEAEQNISTTCTEKNCSTRHEFVYKNCDTRIPLVCGVCGYDEWNPTYRSFVNSTQGCPSCFDLKRGKSQLISQEEAEQNISTTCTEKNCSTRHEFVYIGISTRIPLVCGICGYDKWNPTYHNFVNKKNGCPSCVGHNQLYSYIQLISDNNVPVGIKYGIENTPNSRTKNQNKKSIFEVQRAKTFKYLSTEQCKAAENECKKTFKGIFTKKEVGDGYTETTTVDNLELILEIYKKHGAVEI